MSDGVLLLDKPAGPTSHDAVAAVRRALGRARVGHAGTLDPAATGLLVVLIGRATRLARFVGMLGKRYLGVIRFGWETATDDATGTALPGHDESWRALAREDLEAALAHVRSRPVQVPPAVSAKHVAGERAYRRARRGESVTLEPVPVLIVTLDLQTWEPALGEAGVVVECSAGTYVRAIARDVGRALNSRAHLAALRRTAIGDWDVREALPLDAVGAASVTASVRPMAEAVAHLPAVILPQPAAQGLAHGRPVPVADLAEGLDLASGPVAVYDAGGLLAVAEARAGVLHPEVVLAG